MSKDDEKAQRFGKLVEAARKRVARAADKTVAVNEQAADIVGRFELDLSGPTSCGEPSTASDVCTRVTTDTKPCNYTVLADDPRLRFDVDDLLREVESEVTGLNREELERARLEEDFVGIRVRLVLDMRPVMGCGETNTLMSTCTKITSGTNTCVSTEPLSLPPDFLGDHVIDMDDILLNVRERLRDQRSEQFRDKR